MKLCSFLTGFAAFCFLAGGSAQAVEGIWVEAESFSEAGGWVLDTQFIEIMGSPYLMAHGLGRPVADAVTKVGVPAAGTYRVWARSKNWVGPWGAPGAPGRFGLVVGGRELERDFGMEGKDWRWEDGGRVELPAGEVEVVLRDRTGFDGRLDALILTRDAEFRPSDDFAAVAALRREMSGLPAKLPESEEYDLVVVGGGYAGMGAAISGARQGLKVALLQNRPVLGGEWQQ